jgi:23S rRNA pseudouridine1911/1915/1917 synthase
MADHFVAARAGAVFDLLTAHFAAWSRNTLRERLRRGCIEVDGAIVQRADHAVAAGAAVTVRALGEAAAPPPRRGPGPSLPVLHLDADLLAIDKPAGLLSVSTDDENRRTALALARGLLPGGHGELWPAHRLDRETSGVLLLARSRDVRDRVQAAWERTRKVYVAITAGVPTPADGTIDLPLWEDHNLRVRTGAHPEARPARTHYRTVRTVADRALLEVELDTGRKHQIRVHLQSRGWPVLGDDRYGAADERLFLHAARLELPHPRDGRPLVLTAPVPSAFAKALAAGGR